MCDSVHQWRWTVCISGDGQYSVSKMGTCKCTQCWDPSSVSDCVHKWCKWCGCERMCVYISDHIGSIHMHTIPAV